MTVASQANVLVIHDTVIRLLSKREGSVVSTNFLLQGAGTESLNWSEAELDGFLAEQVVQRFGVSIQKQHIRSTVNGLSPTVGDLSIAISNGIHRQYHPRKRW